MSYPPQGPGITRPISPPLELTELVDAVCSETEAQAMVDALIHCTVFDFQLYAATGDVVNPGKINDNDTGTVINPTAGKYIEVDFNKAVIIKRWRQFGTIWTTGDGRFKIEYWDITTRAWADWVTDIPVRTTADWSNYVTETEKTTLKVKLTCTTTDTYGSSLIGELEVIY